MIFYDSWLVPARHRTMQFAWRSNSITLHISKLWGFFSVVGCHGLTTTLFRSDFDLCSLHSTFTLWFVFRWRASVSCEPWANVPDEMDAVELVTTKFCSGCCTVLGSHPASSRYEFSALKFRISGYFPARQYWLNSLRTSYFICFKFGR